MVMTPELRRKVDQIRDYLYGGGYPNPVLNAEQLAFLFFFYMVEGLDADNELRAQATGKPYKSIFAGEWKLRNPLNAPTKGQETIPAESLRWSRWHVMAGEPLVRFVRDEVFPSYTEVADRSAMNFMDGARLSIDEPTVLTQVVSLVDQLRLEEQDADTKGDLFEHVLRQIKQAGELGQFRTRRHIIRAIVEMIDPKLGETVYDPAAGTAGFLVGAYNHIRLVNSSDAGTYAVEINGKVQKRGWGDRLSDAQNSRLQNGTFYGNDVDPAQVRLATMNLTLRGLPNVRILRRNALTQTLDRATKAKLGLPLEGFDIVFANPPFSGRLDKDRIVDEVKVGSSTATELLFLKYMLGQLKDGGRCGVIVPEGVLFGSTGAHKELRRQLIDNNRVEAALSLPSGVFQPYSGVKTSVLLFTKGGSTDRVLFLHTDADGFKLDANHDTPISEDDLPALVDAYLTREDRWSEWHARDVEAEWSEKWWFADAATIRANDHNLSTSRYRPQSRAAVEYRDPLELLDELKAIAAEMSEEIEELSVKLQERVA